MNDTRPLVVKVGGGLLRADGLDGLRRACAEVIAISERRQVLVVPGGGPFADAVRAIDERVGLPDDVAHTLALQAMDQLGVLLRPMLPGADLLAELVAPRGVALLRAAPAFADRSEVPESWAVTSDSLAVLAAAAIGSDSALLLKPVAGVLARWPSDEPPVPTLTVAELELLQAGGGGAAVDPYLAEAVRRTGIAVTVRAPSSANTGLTGTRIIPG